MSRPGIAARGYDDEANKTDRQEVRRRLWVGKRNAMLCYGMRTVTVSVTSSLAIPIRHTGSDPAGDEIAVRPIKTPHATSERFNPRSLIKQRIRHKYMITQGSHTAHHIRSLPLLDPSTVLGCCRWSTLHPALRPSFGANSSFTSRTLLRRPSLGPWNLSVRPDKVSPLTE